MRYKKLVFAAPGKVELQEDDIDLNSVPDGKAIIKTHYSLISAGTELACLSGRESWFTMPAVYGYSSVGEIKALGKNVKGFQPGDIVFQYGQHAEFITTPVSGVFLKIPAGLDEKLAPFARMAAIAMTAMRVSEIELGDYVAVIGQGLVGIMAAQLARLQGATVIVADVSAKRLELSRACGIEHRFNPGQCNLKEKVMALTGGKGVSTLIDASGSPQVIVESLPLIGRLGELILLGSPRGEYQGNITDVLNVSHLCPRCVTFKGAHEWRYPVAHDDFVKHSLERNTRIIFDLMVSNRLLAKPLISHVLKAEQAGQAYEGLRTKKDEYYGVLFDWA
ncbi:MAG: zinc-binding alcohol dehydrogenase [Kiritimatiellaeota bacterium]|nr:zinc-binding alcohol dehydrogenase [Kiritimatiellota bacterium]